ncbi:LytTR family DNA-binding domain-containing protein [Dyadobacter sp. CY326]|uniref:LytR/AlgR family response regulator transcription factor n=1 Tax=Dyadobacter sp. CY326 TaxID=2907300 RepID=UPI001F22427B|nr:LytTR family DNA-binding domain-containing protein [Dyadobacter sp. CY326]MCE7068601.1 LytTR family DNA-binding domain-containing protein [Dyadobacter sp. CY326]
MKILIVEDEDLAVDKLKATLKKVDTAARVIGITASITSTVKWLATNPNPDLILMDIELADGQSFEIFDQIRVKTPVIFITSYDEYALRAFKVNSIDYLLKPVQKEDLSAALDKYRSFKETFGQSSENQNTNIEKLVQELQNQFQPKEYRKRFLVKHIQKLVSVEVEAISYFFSEERISFFKTYDDKQFIVDYNMDELEELLDPAAFFRISRSVIISVKAVNQISDYFGHRLALKLQPGFSKESIVSREKVQAFKVWMGK